MKKNRILAGLMAFVFSFAFVLAAFPQSAQAAEDKMTIYAIDLGAKNSGEATMIVAGNGSSLLIDTGENTTTTLLTWLEKKGYKKGGSKKFDLLISHWHPDHMGYAKKLIEEYNVGKVYIPPKDPNNESNYYKVYNAADAEKKTIVKLADGKTIQVGKNVTGKVLVVNKNPKLTEKGAANNAKGNRENNMSAVIMFTGGGSKFLTCGDIRCETEELLLKGKYDLKADIFKMSHHGYYESNSHDFLKAVNPSYAWFTTHDASRTKFIPDSVKEPVRVLGSMANMFATRYNGAICFTSTNGKITVKAVANTAKLYRKAKNRNTEEEEMFEFTLNTAAVPRITDKLIDLSLYSGHRQVNADGSIFKGAEWRKTLSPYGLEDSTGILAVDTLAIKDGKYYWLDVNGKRIKDFKTINGKTYYFGPARAEGFAKVTIKDNTFTYYLMNPKCPDFKESERGVMATGFRTVNTKKYYLTDEKLSDYTKAARGRRVEDRIAEIDGKKYYFDENGVMQTGAKSIKDEKTGITYKYYFNAEGVMQKGFRTINGAKYYYSPSNGRMLYGKQRIDGKSYFFDEETGAMYVNKTVTIDGKTYMCGKNGVMTLQTGTNASNSVSKDSKGGIIEAQPDENVQAVPEEGNTGTVQSEKADAAETETAEEADAPEEVKEDAEAETADTEEIKEEQKEETDTAAAEEGNDGAAEQTETQETAEQQEPAEQQDAPAGQEIPDAEMEIIEPAA